MTPDEFDATTNVDDRFRYGLVRGILVVLARPSMLRADANEELGHLLRKWGDRDPGTLLDATLPEQHVRLPECRRLADRLVWCGLGRVPDDPSDVPTIAVDSVTRAKRDWPRDYDEKRAEYLAVGIKEYWIIDRFRRTFTVFRPDDPGPAEQQFGEADTYRTPLLPGFELPLAKLFFAAGRWKRPRRDRESAGKLSSTPPSDALP